MERTKTMYEVLLEERLAERLTPATCTLYGVYRRSKQEFLKLYEDLPEDDVERVAAETYVKSLKNWSHPILTKYTVAQSTKALKEKRDLATAKVRINKDMYIQAIKAYNEMLDLKAKLAICESTFAKHSAEIRTVLKSERSQETKFIKNAIWKYAEKKFRVLRTDKNSAMHASSLVFAIRTGKFPKVIPQ